MDTEIKTKRFLSRVLRDHYRSVELYLPYRFTRREFAFVYMGGKGMHRPVGFSTKKEVSDFLVKKTPLHTYYSTAYYSNPKVPMKDKEWLGADLVFDLDADHLPGGDRLTYPEQLDEVRKKTQLLVHDFLIDDFGFDEDELHLYFSGHRGYHIHIRSKKVLNMSSQARREVVDYITGMGLDIEAILPYEDIEVDSYRKFKTIAKSPKLPDPNFGGWGKKMRRLTIQLLERWAEMERNSVIQEMKEKHKVGDATAEGLYEELYEEGKWKMIADKGVLDVFHEERNVNVNTFLGIIKGILDEKNIKEIGSQIIGTTDEPVTGDIKRLIRLPTSIHGGSFLEVTPIDIDEFSDFDPLEKAIPSCLSRDKKDLSIENLPDLKGFYMGGEYIQLDKEITVPEFAAPFIISKYKAKLL
ncbi:MAG: DNA primase catalytic subunit PriS [Candidatus Saliniplasma sp.]